MSEPLINIVARLDDFPWADRFEFGPTIFCRRPWVVGAQAVVLSEETAHGVAPSAPEYAYLLEVSIAREVLQVWSNWRSGAKPTPEQAAAAVIHYAEHDTYLPLE